MNESDGTSMFNDDCSDGTFNNKDGKNETIDHYNIDDYTLPACIDFINSETECD
nr:hypothetical protein [Bacteroidota bacterium]